MKDPRFGKFLLAVNAMVPLALMAWDYFRGQLGANPKEFALRTTGVLTLVMLVLSLAVTPLRKVSGWNWLSHFRRMLGLCAFFYGGLHLLCYAGWGHGWDARAVFDDTVKRPFITLGMAAFLMMVPLAATSTNAAIKRLGARRWKALHKLAYATAVAGVAHYWMGVKADASVPLGFAAVLAMLLGYRIWDAVRPRNKPTPPPVAAQA